MKKIIKIWLILIVMLFALGLILFYYSEDTGQKIFVVNSIAFFYLIITAKMLHDVYNRLTTK